jgi:hypothetical protein
MSPSPPPPLAYPPTLWLILSYNVVPYAEYTEVLITTDVALQLGLYYSHIKPTLTDRLRWRRGQTYVRDKHWSFSPLGVLPQMEEGDTTSHTYQIPPDLLPGPAWLKFEHDYPGQWKCPLCGATSLPRFQALVKQQGAQFVESRYACRTCQCSWPQQSIRNLTTSHSVSPFFYAPRAESSYSLRHLESFYQYFQTEELFFDEFSS